MSAGKAAGKERKDLFDERKDSAKKQKVEAGPKKLKDVFDVKLEEPSGRSPMYRFFKTHPDRNQLVCVACFEKKTLWEHPLATSGNLLNHMRSHHAVLLETADVQSKEDGLKALGFSVVPKLDSKQEAVTKQLAKWIATSLRPIHLVNDVDFKILLEMLNPTYKLPGAAAVKKRIVDLRIAMRRHIRKELGQALAVAFTADGWTANTTSHFIGVTCHVIDSKWKMQTFCLAVRELHERSTADVQAAIIQQVAVEYGVWDKLFYITTDGASDIGKACELMHRERKQLDQLLCVCHRLNLVLGNAYEVRALVLAAWQLALTR